MKHQTIADSFAELGHSTRLEIYRHLVKTGKDGLPVGDLRKTLKMPGSTLSHHIGRLISVGLISQRREGTTLYCVPEYDRLEGLIAFLGDECCVDEQIQPTT